jgi:hypothetical protein
MWSIRCASPVAARGRSPTESKHAGRPLGTLRDWDERRVEPGQAARAYLKVIAREPEIVREALKPPPAAV